VLAMHKEYDHGDHQAPSDATILAVVRHANEITEGFGAAAIGPESEGHPTRRKALRIRSRRPKLTRNRNL
jgi:hypothetical protein